MLYYKFLSQFSTAKETYKRSDVCNEFYCKEKPVYKIINSENGTELQWYCEEHIENRLTWMKQHVPSSVSEKI